LSYFNLNNFSFIVKGKLLIEIDPDNDIEKAVSAAAEVDLVVLCIGENTYTEGLGSISDLNIDAGQLELSQRILATNKSVVVVYLGKTIWSTLGNVPRS